MSRRTFREAVVSALTTGARFGLIKEGAARSFDAATPVAVVTSAGTQLINLTRGLGGDERRYEVSVSLYIRCEAGQEADAEDALDALSEATITDLQALGYGVPGTDAAPADAPLRIIDGTLYRVERLRVTTQEYD